MSVDQQEDAIENYALNGLYKKLFMGPADDFFF